MSHALLLPTHDQILDRSVHVLDHIFPLPRAFDIRLWNGLTLPAAGRSSFTLVLRHPAALRRMFSPPIERSLGEAFRYGDYDLEGDLVAAFTLFHVIFERRQALAGARSGCRSVSLRCGQRILRAVARSRHAVFMRVLSGRHGRSRHSAGTQA